MVAKYYIAAVARDKKENGYYIVDYLEFSEEEYEKLISPLSPASVYESDGIAALPLHPGESEIWVWSNPFNKLPSYIRDNFYQRVKDRAIFLLELHDIHPKTLNQKIIDEKRNDYLIYLCSF